MNRHTRSTGRIVLGGFAAFFGLISTMTVLINVLSPRDPIPATRLIVPGALLVLGVALLLREGVKLGDSWKTEDPKKAGRIVRKLSRVQDDRTLMEIGKNAPLEEVARAAFGRVKSQSELSYFVRNGDNSARQRLALEYVTDEVALRDIAMTNKEPFAFLALDRMKNEKRIAEVAASPEAGSMGTAALKRLEDPGALSALAENQYAPVDIRRRAYEKLGKPGMRDAMVLLSPGARSAEKKETAARILESGDTAAVLRAAEGLCRDRRAPDAVARDFLTKAAKAWPDALLPLGQGTWANGCGDIIRASAWDAQGRAVEAARLRMESPAFPQGDKIRAGKRLLKSGVEQLILEVVERLLAGKADPAEKGFVLDAATAYPGIIQSVWQKVREWGHTSVNDHTDITPQRPHYDSTQYLDFYRYPDGRLVAKRDGRKKHTDSHASSSDCTDYSHTDTNKHTDTWDTDYLARFPQAVKGDG